jgi:hypothetical protein
MKVVIFHRPVRALSTVSTLIAGHGFHAMPFGVELPLMAGDGSLQSPVRDRQVCESHAKAVCRGFLTKVPAASLGGPHIAIPITVSYPVVNVC